MNQVQLPKTVYATFAGSIDPTSLSRIFQNFGGAVTGKVFAGIFVHPLTGPCLACRRLLRALNNEGPAQS
jgi:hypothetical protein